MCAVTQIISLLIRLKRGLKKLGAIDAPYEPYPYKTACAVPSNPVFL